MKKLLLGLVLVTSMGTLASCEDSSKIPAPEVTSVPLILAKASSDPAKNYFDRQRAAASINGLTQLSNPTRPVFEFSFDIPDQRDVRLKTVEVYKSFKRDVTIGPRVLVGAYDSFPATISLNSQDALAGLQRLFLNGPTATLPTPGNLLTSTPANPDTPNPLLNGDVVVFTFEYVLQDGSRVILTPLSDVKLANGATVKVISGNQINPPYALYAEFQVR